MRPKETRARRPVYVLGAGFSRAISQHMPLTDELGAAITSRLGITWPSGSEENSFEDQLTLLSTSLPFLAGHENTSRRAIAEEVTATLAEELEDRNNSAAAGESPLWLRQLVSLWQAEQATVVTFNYDTLVEQAVTALRPAVLDRGASEPKSVHGWQVVFPAPTPVNALTYESLHGPTQESFQLLKLHGSLNWYWSLGESATIVRDATVCGFGSRSATTESDEAGVKLLDRFLIPPVTSKDSYYNVNLVHRLWRTAHDAMQQASRLTIIGYSMPAADRIAAELLCSVPDGTPVDIVNWKLGSEADLDSPIGRIKRLGMNLDRTWEGESAVSDYVSNGLNAASRSLLENSALNKGKEVGVVVSITPNQSSQSQRPVPASIRANSNGKASVVGFNWQDAGNSNMPPTEFSLQLLSTGSAELSDFYTGRSLLDAVQGGKPFLIQSINGIVRVIGATRIEIGRWPAIYLWTTPESDS
ncbi:SIR2-like protein [Rhodoglobus vestalii]|uniref:SIR2-like protein n=1 Tax=Rhodoglobus vestalii TaxID=193384 RepID=A0A8H2K330_9MICO|nr:SIR2 family protein [Rhodoglobus vestalii]TQO18853.1 SIR2-like protein [Rhodoglobus vestalii]